MSTSTTGMERARVGRSSSAPIRDRRPGWAALAVTLMVGLGVLFGYLYVQAGAKTPIVVMARTVRAGHEITRADLSTISVAGPLTTIAGDDLDRVVGRIAAKDILKGAPLQPAHLSAEGALRAGQAQVGVRLTSGQVPADGVEVGDTVEVLRLPDTNQGEGAVDPAQVLVPAAPVWAVESDPGQPGGVLLTVTVPAQMVGDIVSASAAERVAVVRVVTGS